jgi:hypothetical protein
MGYDCRLGTVGDWYPKQKEIQFVDCTNSIAAAASVRWLWKHHGLQKVRRPAELFNVSNALEQADGCILLDICTRPMFV